MSTVVFRDGVMAADSRAYSGGRPWIGSKHKISKFSDGGLIGVTTTQPGLSEAFVRWMGNGRIEGPGKPEIREGCGFSAILVLPDMTVLMFEESFDPIGPLEAPYFAIGSGRETALGALYMGATAEEAISAAICMDVWSEGPILEMRLGPPPAPPEPAENV